MSFVNQENPGVLDFRPFGRVVDNYTDDEIFWSAVEETCKNSKIPKERPYFWFDCSPIKSSMPLKEVQSTISDVVNNIGQNYAKLALEEKINNDSEEIEFGYARAPVRGHDISYVDIQNVNPVQWKIFIQHELPLKLDGMRDEFYQDCILKDKRLYLKMEINIYIHRECDNFIGHFVEIHRLSGRSQVYYDFYRNVCQVFAEKEKINWFYKAREPLLLLYEGLDLHGDFINKNKNKNKNIVTYLLNDLIMRELCSFIGNI